MMSPKPLHLLKQLRFTQLSRCYLASVLLALIAMSVALSGCASTPATTSNTGNNGASSATSTPAPTATAKPKPTSVPTTSVAYCQGLLSLADVNSIMKPAAPATNILFENDPPNHQSACSWTPGQTIAVLAVFFLPLPAGTSLESLAEQQLAKGHVPTGGNISTTPVSGVGDQAFYLSASIPTPAGLNYAADLVVADGGIVLGCAQTGAGSVPTGLQSELAQACKAIISQM